MNGAQEMNMARNVLETGPQLYLVHETRLMSVTYWKPPLTASLFQITKLFQTATVCCLQNVFKLPAQTLQ